MQDNISSTPQENEGPQVGLPAGTRLGKYEIEKVLGVGAQSVVYLGRDRLLDRPVAIKQISANLLADARFLKRFRSEAKILAQLGREGASIVSVFDLIENEKGMFIAMEYVDGRTLKDILTYQKYALPVKITGEILLAVSSGLKVAHAAGIVHRDIKPGNIMVTRRHEARIMDFGVAARSGEDDSMSLGTTKYMAPEVFKGAAVDARADIYSLGMMAYEMLTGRLFFDRVFAEVIAEQRTENLRWMKWHCDESLAAPPLAEINPLINKQLSNVVARMMAKNPDDRYGSIDELLAGIEPALEANLEQDAQVDHDDPDKVRSAELNPGDMDLIAEAAEQFGDDAPTGKAPATPRQRKRRMIAGIVIVAAILLGAVVFAVNMGLEHRARLDQAGAAWQAIGETVTAAKQKYLKGEVAESRSLFDEAVGKLDAYAQQYADLPDGTAKPGAWKLFCQASIAMIDGDIAQADAEFIKVKDMDIIGDETLGTFSSWLTVRQDALAYLFDLEQAIANEEFDRAELARANFSRLRQPPADLNRRADILFDKLNLAKRRFDYSRAIKAGDAAVDIAVKLASGDDLSLFPQAQTYVSEAEDQYRKAELLEYTDEVADRKRKLESARAYLSARAEYLRGRTEQLDRRIELARAIVAAKPDDAGARELLDSLLAQSYLEQARSLLGSSLEDDMLAARDALNESIRLHRTPEAGEALDKLQRRIRRTQLLAEAAKMRDQGRRTEELALLKEAAGYGMDDALQLMMEQSEIEAHLQTGENYRMKRNWPEALAEYEKARKIRINDGLLAARIDTLVDLLTRQKTCYEDIADGRALVEQQEYEKAIRKLRKAIAGGRDLQIDLTEAETLLALASYHTNLERGVELLDMQQPQMALAHFQAAKKNRDTPEIRDLIARAETMVQTLSQQQDQP